MSLFLTLFSLPLTKKSMLQHSTSIIILYYVKYAFLSYLALKHFYYYYVVVYVVSSLCRDRINFEFYALLLWEFDANSAVCCWAISINLLSALFWLMFTLYRNLSFYQNSEFYRFFHQNPASFWKLKTKQSIEMIVVGKYFEEIFEWLSIHYKNNCRSIF